MGLDCEFGVAFERAIQRQRIGDKHQIAGAGRRCLGTGIQIDSHAGRAIAGDLDVAVLGGDLDGCFQNDRRVCAARAINDDRPVACRFDLGTKVATQPNAEVVAQCRAGFADDLNVAVDGGNGRRDIGRCSSQDDTLGKHCPSSAGFSVDRDRAVAGGGHVRACDDHAEVRVPCVAAGSVQRDRAVCCGDVGLLQFDAAKVARRHACSVGFESNSAIERRNTAAGCHDDVAIGRQIDCACRQRRQLAVDVDDVAVDVEALARGEADIPVKVDRVAATLAIDGDTGWIAGAEAVDVDDVSARVTGVDFERPGRIGERDNFASR